jgi:hypothetical protein
MHMSRSLKKRWTLGGLVATTAATVTLVVGLAVGAGAGAAAVTASPANTEPPTVSGTAEVGSTLTAAKGTWTGTEPIDYSYQWKRYDADGGSCANVGGARTSTYVLKSVDSANTLRATVTGKNSDGSKTATSVPTALVKAAVVAPPPAATGCGKATNGTIAIADVGSPARLLVDQAQVSPSSVTFSTSNVTARFHVTACGAGVQGALVYVTATPYNQFSIPNEQPTGADGWATLQMNKLSGFPGTPTQQLLVMFVRARKSGESTLGGISSRRLVSFRVTR